MDIFTQQFSDSNQQEGLSSSSQQGLESASSVDKPGSSSLSDTGFTTHQSAQSEEEIILASSRPKKRAGRRVFKETRHPVFRGVRRRNNNKWVCELREPNKKSRIWLGTYPTAEMAARAHDVAALALRGKQACLNYADSSWRLPIPASEDQLDIRRAAAEAAEMFRPNVLGGGSYSSGDEQEKEMKAEVEVVMEMEMEMKGISSNSSRSSKGYMYMEDEDVFDMPMLLSNMAEGLLLSPPHHYMDSWKLDDDVESANDFNLWSF